MHQVSLKNRKNGKGKTREESPEGMDGIAAFLEEEKVNRSGEGSVVQQSTLNLEQMNYAP